MYRTYQTRVHDLWYYFPSEFGLGRISADGLFFLVLQVAAPRAASRRRRRWSRRFSTGRVGNKRIPTGRFLTTVWSVSSSDLNCVRYGFGRRNSMKSVFGRVKYNPANAVATNPECRRFWTKFFLTGDASHVFAYLKSPGRTNWKRFVNRRPRTACRFKHNGRKPLRYRGGLYLFFIFVN